MHRNADMTIARARELLSPWGGYSELLHKAALAMPSHLRDPEIVTACELLAKTVSDQRQSNPRKREKVYADESLSDDDRKRLATLSKSKKLMLGPLESEDCGHGKKRIYRWIWDVGSEPCDSEPDVVTDPDCKVCYPEEDDAFYNPARRTPGADRS